VYKRHHGALYRYCRSIVRHEQDAQDALQNAMTRAYAALRDEPRDVDLRPWLFRIAHNESVSILRRRRPTVELDAGLAGAGGLDERVEAQEKLGLLRQDLADLPERQRAALVLRELSGLAPAEIAELLETTPGAIKQSILEARRALSKCDEGRATPCYDVQRALSDGDRRVLRGRGLRAHLRSCPSCRRFQSDLGRRPGELAALAPAGLSGALLAGAQVSAGAGAGGVAAGVLMKAGIAAVMATGAVTGVHELRHLQHPPPPVVHHVAKATPEPARARASAVVSPVTARTPVGSGSAAVAPQDAATPWSGRRLPAATDAPARHRRRGASPGRAGSAVAHEDAIPPGQAKKARGAGWTPPGQAKKGAAGEGVPPGQSRKDAVQGQADASVPAGQGNRDAAGADVPPGHRSDRARPTSGQAIQDPTGSGMTSGGGKPDAAGAGTASGQAMQGSTGAVTPPGLAKHRSTGAVTPPGLAKHHSTGAVTPPGLAKHHSTGAVTPPGLAKQGSPAAVAPPGQVKGSTGADMPPGLAKKTAG
jgi:RNA polymerase sigma factor (sigma-70 family)